MTADELKSCPFCGGEGAVAERSNPMSKWKWSVDCASSTCGASGPVEATKFAAITAWNTRPTPSASEDKVAVSDEALVEEMERDIRIAIWNAGMTGGMGQELTQAFIKRAMSDPSMLRAIRSLTTEVGERAQ